MRIYFSQFCIKQKLLNIYFLEALAVIAQFIGPDNFKHLANDSLQLGLRILDQSNDPDIKKSVYALFAALAIVMKEEISPALPKIVNELITSIQSSEGIVVCEYNFILITHVSSFLILLLYHHHHHHVYSILDIRNKNTNK